MTNPVRPPHHPYAAFPLTTRTMDAHGLRYPRAGVRLLPDGKWLLQIWYARSMVRHDRKKKTFATRVAAFKQGQREIHAARSSPHPAGQLWLRSPKQGGRP
jgi:hypothetical protein